MTIPYVFIIESLNFDDEQNNRYEGRFLSQILHLGGKESAYCYIQTENEFKKALRLFRVSGYRYLHLSCHGSRRSISTTLDDISFSRLSNLVKPYLKNKRLFISACSAVNDDLAKVVIPSSGCSSIVGPIEEIQYNDAAIFWASFYHLVFTKDPKKMKRENILPTLRRVANTFRIPIDYFSRDRKKEKGYKKTEIRPKYKRIS